MNDDALTYVKDVISASNSQESIDCSQLNLHLDQAIDPLMYEESI